MSDTAEDEKDHKLPISASSVLLEGCTGRAQGKSIKIFLNECSEYLLYPGQVVGVLGHMSTAGLHAQQIVSGVSVPDFSIDSILVSSELHVTVACGPFSPEKGLIFDSISDLEVRIREKAPDKLILMGPFLDINHPEIASGILFDSFQRPASLEDIYKEEIIPKLARLARACENARTELIIVPSTSEARIDYPLPQPPIDTLKSPLWQTLKKEVPNTVKFVSNPATLQIGNFKMLLTSADALTSINTNVLFKQTEKPDALGRVDACLEAMLKARTLFPVMPSNLRIEPSLRHNMDLEESEIPHIVVFPSISGKRFIKRIANRVFVNPGFMSDSTGSSSSIAELVISPGSTPESITGDVLKL
jgi:DNA polymerase alpha subunit B